MDSVTWWSVAGMLEGPGEALRKVALRLHLADVASALAALPAKPPISIAYWKAAGAEITTDGTALWRPGDKFSQFLTDVSAATRAAACLPTVSSVARACLV
jgi:hypothetical protein